MTFKEYIHVLKAKYEDLGSNIDLLCMGRKLSDLKGISEFKNLIRVDCSENSIKSFEGLENMEFLKIVRADYNPIRTLKYLPESVERLECSNINVSSLKDISSLKNLIHLTIHSSTVKSLDGIQELSNLKYLTLSGVKIKSIDEISKLQNLWSIDVSNNRITSLPEFHDFDKLKILKITNNQISDLSNIENCSELKYLNFISNNVSLLRPLKNLNNIWRIFISGNPLRKEDVYSFLKKTNIGVVDSINIKTYLSNLENIILHEKLKLINEDIL